MGPTHLITFLTTQGWLECQLRGDLLPGHSLHWVRRPLYSAVSLRRIHGSGIKGYEEDNPVLHIMLSVPVMLDSSSLESLKKEHFYQGTLPVVTVPQVLWARREAYWFPRFAITNHHIGEGLKIHRDHFSGSSGVWTSKIRVLSNQQGLASSEAQRKKRSLPLPSFWWLHESLAHSCIAPVSASIFPVACFLVIAVCSSLFFRKVTIIDFGAALAQYNLILSFASISKGFILK